MCSQKQKKGFVKIKKLALKVHEERELKRRTAQAIQAAVWSCELLVLRLRHANAGPLAACNAARRRVRRIVGVGMGLLRHDGEVEGVVVDDAGLVLGICGTAHAMLKRMSQNDEATIVFHEFFRAGCHFGILRLDVDLIILIPR